MASKKLVLLLMGSLFFDPHFAHAKVVSFGHNLTSTTHVLDKGQFELGVPAVAVGISEKFTAGTSTWLMQDYNMYNLYLRYLLKKNESYSQALQASYYKTDGGSNTYRMEAGWLNWIHGWHFNSGYIFFLNAQFMYFVDETIPFSLRRPRVWRDPTEFNISTLHEVKLVHGFYLMGELGILGVVRKFPLIHSGASLQWRSNHWLIQIGYSTTATLAAIGGNRKYRQDVATYISNGDDHGLGDHLAQFIKYDYSLHPEVVIQWYY